MTIHVNLNNRVGETYTIQPGRAYVEVADGVLPEAAFERVVPVKYDRPVGDYIPRSEWASAREAHKHRQKTIVREYQNEVTNPDALADSIVGVANTFRDAMHLLDEGCVSKRMQRNILDSVCAAIQRQLNRTEAAMARETQSASEPGALPPELESVEQSRISDAVAEHAADIAALRHALDGATDAFSEIVGEPWVPASQTQRVYHPALALATEVALGNVRPAVPEAKGFRVVVMGSPDAHDRQLVTEWLDRARAKYGDRLWLYTGDRAAGVDGTVADWARRSRLQPPRQGRGLHPQQGDRGAEPERRAGVRRQGTGRRFGWPCHPRGHPDLRSRPAAGLDGR
jgi:YspA, cpYpsA-related SLOG family